MSPKKKPSQRSNQSEDNPVNTIENGMENGHIDYEMTTITRYVVITNYQLLITNYDLICLKYDFLVCFFEGNVDHYVIVSNK